MSTAPAHQRPIAPMASLAVDHHRHLSFKPWKRRSRLRSFPHPDPTLLDLSALPAAASKFNRSLSTPCFATAAKDQQHLDRVPDVEILGSRRSRGIHSLVVQAAVALACGAVPIPASSGLGGAYFLSNRRSGECFAVVKPIDEDPLAATVVTRPGSGISVRAGETGLREVAAYLLDHGGFSGVPPTALVKISHPALQRKVASIQRFVPHDYDAGDLGPSRFSVVSVHRIGILDVRLLNIDRHAGNLLVKKRVSNAESAAELVPIDHGLCLPELLDDPYFEWLHWPQAAIPFSEQEGEYVSSLDPYKDAELLRNELPSLREPAIRILILCTIFLKGAVASGLCLADIGGMMTREFCGVEEEPSALESLCKQAEASIASRSMQWEDSDRVNESADSDEDRIQFDMDCDEDSYIQEVIDIPLLLRSNRESVFASEEREEECLKLGSITKSVSLSAAEFNTYECVGGGGGGSNGSKCISFKAMSEERWRRFLESFEQVLPEAFESRKGMGLKQRLGTSCKF